MNGASGGEYTERHRATRAHLSLTDRNGGCRLSAAARTTAPIHASVIAIRDASRETVMKPLTLVSRKVYFGVDAQRMREASARVLARLEGQPDDRAVVRLDALVEDFRVTAAASRSMVDEMLRRGLLERRDARGAEYGVTE